MQAKSLIISAGNNKNVHCYHGHQGSYSWLNKSRRLLTTYCSSCLAGHNIINIWEDIVIILLLYYYVCEPPDVSVDILFHSILCYDVCITLCHCICHGVCITFCHYACYDVCHILSCCMHSVCRSVHVTYVVVCITTCYHACYGVYHTMLSCVLWCARVSHYVMMYVTVCLTLCHNACHGDRVLCMSWCVSYCVMIPVTLSSCVSHHLYVSYCVVMLVTLSSCVSHHMCHTVPVS